MPIVMCIFCDFIGERGDQDQDYAQVLVHEEVEHSEEKALLYEKVDL